MARHRAIPAAIAHALVATVVAAGEPATTFRFVADTSTPIPDGAGSFGFVFDPAIDGGNPVFWGRDVAGNDGIYSDLGSGLIRVADRTTLIPSGTGTFETFGGDPMIKDGRVMLVGWGSGGQMGIYTYQSTLERAVDLSMAVPNGAGNFTFTGWPSLNGGMLHFLGVGATGRRGIYSYDFNGNVGVLVDATTLIPQGTGRFISYEAPSNENGDLAFRGDGISNQRGIYVQDGDGLRRVADRTTIVPGSKFRFGDFGTIPSLSDGTVAFRGVSPVGPGVYLFEKGLIDTIADGSTPIPEGTGNFVTFGEYISNSHGVVAFVGFGASGQNGIYVGSRTTVTKVIDRSDMLDGKAINQLASIDRDGLDDVELGFIARFTNGSVGAYIATISFPCPEDLDGSGAVDFGDVLTILAAWGNAGGPEDLDGSGIVDFGDLLAVLASWGPCILPTPVDDCGNAPVVGDGTYAYSTLSATTDGPNLPGECDEGNGVRCRKDVWIRYLASGAGTATASVCGSDFDTRIAVYEDGDCPGPFLACNDDACGEDGTRSEVSFPVQSGGTYLIRIGSPRFETGEGTLAIDGAGAEE